jgi:Protein of unknown function (DUF3014)
MDYENLNLRASSQESSSEDTPIHFAEPVERSFTGVKLAVAAVLIAAVAATGYLVFRNRGQAAPPADTSAPAQAAVPTDAAPSPGADIPVIVLPPLNESDGVVRGLVKELSSNPSVAAWLTTDNLIRNFVVVVANIAAGEPAQGRVPVLKPKGTFQVEERGEDLLINSRSYARYLPLATAATSITPEDASRLYGMLKPRIDEAYAELGQPNTTFDQTLERAIVVLLNTPIAEGPIPVEPNGAAVAFRFADPALEKLTPSQKLLIRFGPENQRTVQTALRNIALALGIPAERLPKS